MSEIRKIAAILVADVVGYSRLAGADEDRTLARLRGLRSDLIDPAIAAHHGRVVKRTGDGALVDFRSVVDAVRCAIEVQNGMVERNAGVPSDRRIEFRIGIHLGDVVEEVDGDLMGDGVNIAARLEGIADPGGVCVSASAYEHVRGRIETQFVDLGEKKLKNIARPVRVYAAPSGSPGFTGASGRPALEQGGPYQSGSRRGQTPQFNRIAAVGAMFLCLVAFVLYLTWQSPTPLRCDHASIAVLPFSNLSGDPAQDYFSDGMTEDVIAALGRFSELSVIARAEVQKYKRQPLQLDELSRRLGICYLLEGSLRKNGDQVLVTAQLVDAVSGRLLWSESHDGDLKDLFVVRNQITQNVVGKLAIKLQDIERRRALKKPTDSLDAYDYVLRGREYYGRNTRSGNTDARGMFEQAIKLDPTYASAYAALGSTRLNAAVSGWTEFRDEALREAETMAKKAIELDVDNAEAHRILGRIYLNRLQFDLANAEHDRAITLNPNDAESYDARGEILLYTGHPKEAVESFAIGEGLNPSASYRPVLLGLAYYLQENYQEASKAFVAGISANPDDYSSYAGLTATYAQLGRMDEAAHAADNLRRVWPFFETKRFAEQFEGDRNRALIDEGLRKAGLK